MRKAAEAGSMKLKAVEALDLTGERARILLTCETENGREEFEMTMNRTLAAELATLMVEFLATDRHATHAR